MKLVSDYVLAFAFVLVLLPTMSAFRRFVGRAEGADPIWSPLMLVGAAVVTAVQAATAGVTGAFAYSTTLRPLPPVS